MEKEELIRHLKLEPLADEGGLFVQSYRSDLEIDVPRGNEIVKRRAGTAIYYLLDQKSFSAFHKVKYDEVFHFYYGSPVELLILEDEKTLKSITLGSDWKADMQFQAVVPRNKWQALRMKNEGDFALLGTTVCPGFEFEDFQIGKREELLKEYPEFKVIIEALCRD